MIRTSRVIFGCIIFVVSACHSRTSQSGRYELTLVGKTITIPTSIDCQKDNPNNIKLVSYFDATGCSSCKLKDLYTWRRLLAQGDSLPEWKSLQCLFIFNTSRMECPEQTLSAYRFNHRMLLDSLGCFEQANPELPADPLFHTFLLDRENRVVLVGSPIGNPRMWELYKTTIARLIENDGVLPCEETVTTASE